jgi:hypothetical protein
MLAQNDNPDPTEPPWQQTPWWYGRAKRDRVLLGFVITCALVTAAIFFLIAYGMD